MLGTSCCINIIISHHTYLQSQPRSKIITKSKSRTRHKKKVFKDYALRSCFGAWCETERSGMEGHGTGWVGDSEGGAWRGADGVWFYAYLMFLLPCYLLEIIYLLFARPLAQAL
jgi:hypothetical protein